MTTGLPNANRQKAFSYWRSPSGLSTALRLAQIAPHLTDEFLILEKAHHPRPSFARAVDRRRRGDSSSASDCDVSEVPHVDASARIWEFRGQG